MEIRIITGRELESWLNPANRAESAGWLESITTAAIAGDNLPRDDVRALPVLSRLPLRTDAGDGWLAAARKAVEWCGGQRWAVVGSAGMTGWDYVSWFAGKIGARLRLVLPPQKAAALPELMGKLTEDLRLSPARTTVIAPITKSRPDKEARLHLRDRLMLGLAHHKFPVVTRRGGFWEKALADVGGADERFRASYPARAAEPWREILKDMDDVPALDGGDCLVHWTRGVYGPWFGETTADYFEALTDAISGTPRDALATLKYIALSGILRGQGRMVRGGTPVVSFSPLEKGKLTGGGRWRSWLKRLNWEPYGITIPRRMLEGLGGRPVIYGDKADYDRLPAEDRPFHQFIGAGNKDWRGENEWRLVGDLDLTSMKDDIYLVVPTPKEAELLRRELPFRILSLIR